MNNSYGSDYLSYQRNRSWLRKKIRSLYLRNILKNIEGPAIDFGCGAGELLSRLPKGSIGLEINPHSVAYCSSLGLESLLYDPETDKYAFSQLRPGKYSAFIMAHVLEHIKEPALTLDRIFGSCERLGIKRVIVIVPGLKGFRYDKTHYEFLEYPFFREHSEMHGYALKHKEYYPFNFRWAGKLFTHNELMVLYDRNE